MTDWYVPLREIVDGDLALPVENVPVTAMVDGEKILVGMGYLSTRDDGIIFTSVIDHTEVGEKVLSQLRGKPGAGYITVSEVMLQEVIADG